VRLERRIPVAIALACAGLLGLAAPATGGGGPDSPCRTDPCKAKLHVAGETAKWRSIETFYPHNETLSTLLKVKGRKLRLDGTFGPGACRARYMGSGLMVVVKICGDATPVRVRATRFKGRRGNLVITYQALPAMRGDAR
jgi:hypothetical protein